MKQDTGWGLPGTVRHCECIGETWWHDHPDAVELQRRADEATAELERTTEASRQARAVALCRPRTCGAKAIGAECCRLEHPDYEEHEDFEGHHWFPGQAPR